MSINKFSPNSHFFVDHTNLSGPVAANLATDAFGPVQGEETNKYRTTSFVRTTTTSKIFAICDGHILIQPNKDDSTKINIILKPTVSYAPFKIKYFVYRGVNKADIVNGTKLAHSTSNSPDFLKRIWNINSALATALNHPVASDIEAKLIGYDPSLSDSTLLDSIFFKSESETNLPKCNKGELLGNFTDKIGLDIVLDKGDYRLDYEQELFKFDLGFARTFNYVLDASSIPVSVKKKYRENIHQFVDAAAFWGAHITNGNLYFHSITAPQNSENNIYNYAVKNYQTKHKLYFHLIGERGRSYRFYGASYYPSGKVSLNLDGQAQNLIDYENNGWPILIKEFQQPGTGSPINKFQLSFEYNFDNRIYQRDINFFAYINFPYLDTESFIDGAKIYNSTFVGQSKPIKNLFSNIGEPVGSPSANYSIASFFVCNIKGYQPFPLENYTDDLWTFNTKDIFEGTSGTNKIHFLNRYNLVNLWSLLKFNNAVTQQKVYSDYGKNAAGASKKRKLYITSITDTHGGEKKSYLNTSAFNVSKVSEAITNTEELASFLFNDKGYAVYKGKINDNGNTISTLSLVHKVNNSLKEKFFLFGITEEEYNKLLYNNPSPPATTPSTPHLPQDASNISIQLNEVASTNTESYKKYNVGLKFENTAGGLEVRYPTGTNLVEVYSIDGLFFFSKEYSDYQEFSLVVSENEVHFRPKNSWGGEYGFDWVRIQDSGLPGDLGNRKYLETLGHYYLDGTFTQKDDNDVFFKAEKTEFHSFSQNFFSYPRQKGLESMYFSPWLSIYPSKDATGVSTVFPKTNEEGNLKCLTTVRLNLIFNLTSPGSVSLLKLKFEKKHFDIRSINASSTTILPDTTDELGNVFTNLKINNSSSGVFPGSLEIEILAKNEFSSVKTIQCLSTEGGVEKFAGELKVVPNAKNYRFETNILLVNCSTNLDTSNTVTGFETTSPFPIRNKILSEINRTLNQSLIDVKAFRTITLDLTRATIPNFYTTYATMGTTYLNPHVSHSYVRNRIPIADRTTREMRIFCINEFCADPLTGGNLNITNGEVEDINTPEVILYRSGLYQASPSSINDVNTSGHESMHGLGLHHSFVNLNLYVMKEYITDNVMDYHKNGTSLTTGYRTTTSKYQWNIMKKNSIVTREI
ncbi:hypothetical protein PFY10_06995 [Chryseobacterium daecheongense]|nr:hypothetical protein PFY10_06995 [Chryseobacterium daecheongense]